MWNGCVDSFSERVSVGAKWLFVMIRSFSLVSINGIISIGFSCNGMQDRKWIMVSYVHDLTGIKDFFQFSLAICRVENIQNFIFKLCKFFD